MDATLACRLRLNFNLALIAALIWMYLPGGAAPFVPHPGQISVLIVEETSERDKLTPAQRDVILSNAPGGVRDYCKTHCAKDASGNPEFRCVDKDDDLSRDDKRWQDAMKLQRQGVPWFYVFNGEAETGYGGPVDEKTLGILKEWGGP